MTVGNGNILKNETNHPAFACCYLQLISSGTKARSKSDSLLKLATVNVTIADMKVKPLDTDKATLRSDSFPQLKELLEYLERNDEVKIEIAGHTDNVGTDANNLRLLQERANTILTYLINKGIKPIHFIAKEYGAPEQ